MQLSDQLVVENAVSAAVRTSGTAFTCLFNHLCVCLRPAGGQRAHQGGEGGGKVPPIQLPHQVHEHDGPPSRLLYRLVLSCGMWGNGRNNLNTGAGGERVRRWLSNSALCLFTEHLITEQLMKPVPRRVFHMTKLLKSCSVNKCFRFSPVGWPDPPTQYLHLSVAQHNHFWEMLFGPNIVWLLLFLTFAHHNICAAVYSL